MFRDFLAVIATTERQMFRIELGDDVLMSQFHDLLKRNLSFDNIATTVDVDDVSVPFASSFVHFYEYKKL